MRIVHLIPSVNPKDGGPFEYARMMAEAHTARGHKVSFVSLDSETASWVKKLDVPVRAAGPFKTRIAAAKNYKKAVYEVASEADVAVVHGLWHVANIAGLSALKKAGVPWVTFTHGMLDPYFRKTDPLKHLAKQAVWFIAQGKALSGADCVLFTCEEERRLARNSFRGHQKYKEKVVAFCAADLSVLPEDEATFRSQVPTLGARPYFLFLSRIHPKKACDNLLRAFAKIAERYSEIDLVFAGPDQIGWQEDLVRLAENLGIEKRVHWAGMTSGAAKAAAFKNAVAFTLPSHQENFGIVVAEALSVNTPVLISKRVNIWREIVTDGAGLACEDTVADTSKMLSDFLEMSEPERTAMNAATRPCYEKRFSVEAASEDLENVMRDASSDKKVIE